MQLGDACRWSLSLWNLYNKVVQVPHSRDNLIRCFALAIASNTVYWPVHGYILVYSSGPLMPILNQIQLTIAPKVMKQGWNVELNGVCRHSCRANMLICLEQDLKVPWLGATGRAAATVSVVHAAIVDWTQSLPKNHTNCFLIGPPCLTSGPCSILSA